MPPNKIIIDTDPVSYYTMPPPKPVFYTSVCQSVFVCAGKRT